jgi:hypothetical protein
MGSFNRKDFLKVTGLAGIAGAGFLTGCNTSASNGNRNGDSPFQLTHNQTFNMSGFAAPALETVRVGITGVGSRGRGAVRRLSRIEGVQITALSDLLHRTVSILLWKFLKTPIIPPVAYTDGEEDWKRMCDSDDVDLVYICTPWHLHAPQAVYAMESDNHVATELPAAVTIEECWQLVETSENTRKHCMMLGNVCYDFFEMVTLNMAASGILR